MEIYELERDYASIFRKIIIVLQVITIITLLVIYQAQAVPEGEEKHFLMTATAYSNHPLCIADKHRDGLTATGVPISEGICALNVDMVDGKWIIKSPLNLGDRIYIEDLGYFICADTGRFAERNHKQDMWTIDIYMESYEEAVLFGKQLKKIFVVND